MAIDEQASVFGIAARDLSRLRTVAATALRHGFGELLERSALGRRLLTGASGDADESLRRLPAPVRFRRLLEALGPTWIKLGQILSTRPDRLPPDWIEALQTLQDEIRPVPFETIKEAIEGGLGAPLEEHFSWVDPEPLGTASIAQTHRARTRSGEDVVIKVQRPGVDEIMRRDLDLLYIGARILEASIEDMDIYGPSDTILEFERALMRELDFGHELGNLEAARALVDPARSITVPRPYPELSGRTVLTMELFDGQPVKRLEAGSDAARHVAKEIIHATCKQVLIDGLFHGDPHAGNILVNEAGTLCMIDLGLVGRLNPVQQDQLLTLIFAAMTGDVDAIARVLLAMGKPTQRVNMAEFKEEIIRIRSKYLEVGQFGRFDFSGFAGAFAQAAQRFRIKLAPEYSVMVKAAVTIEGVARSLDPEADIVGIATPYVQRLIKQRLSPERLMQDALTGAGQLGGLLHRLPGQLDQILHDVEAGHLQVRAVSPSLDELGPAVALMARRMVLVGFAATMSLCAALLLPNDPTTALGIPWLSLFCVVMAVLFWAALLGKSVVGEAGPIRVGSWVKLFKR